MKAVALIVEYNPFHNGHLWHLQKSKIITNADVTVAIMSGNFLQRGEPALVDKWTRTQMCLAAGVDIVFELPTIYATSSAEQFAWGAVSIIEQLNSIDSLCFGSEIGDIAKINKIAKFIHGEPTLYTETLKYKLSSGYSYANAVSQAISTSMSDDSLIEVYSKPNNLLGLMYVASLIRINSKVKAYTIKRKLADYHQEDISDQNIASATAIRKLIDSKGILAVSNYTPQKSIDLLLDNYNQPVTLKLFEDIVFSIIMNNSSTSLQTISGIDSPIANSIMNKIKSSSNLNELLSLLKTKNYTSTRINRVIISILLNIKKADCNRFQKPKYVKLLGFSKKGQEFLQLNKKKTDIEIISKWSNLKNNNHLIYDNRATAIYSLCEKKVRRNNYSLSQLMKRDYSIAPILYK